MALLDRRSRSRDRIHVTAKLHDYFPKSFVWRGRRRDVEAVERCWTVAGRSWLGHAGRIERHCFRVRCADGVYYVYQNLADNTWYIDRHTAD